MTRPHHCGDRIRSPQWQKPISVMTGLGHRGRKGKVILIPAEEGTDGAICLARKLVKENPDKYFMPDQFSNACNYQVHYENTVLEIWQQMQGNIDYLVCAVGTSMFDKYSD